MADYPANDLYLEFLYHCQLLAAIRRRKQALSEERPRPDAYNEDKPDHDINSDTLN